MSAVAGGETLLEGRVKSNACEGVTLSDFLFISDQLSADGTQKKMSSLCMELMKLRNKRCAKEKVGAFALHRVAVLSC